MATTYTVTKSFSSGATAVASEVNQNFTDILTALNSFDITNTTGTLALARISSLTSSQMSSAFFKDEDNMASNSATAVASQQSVKAHVAASSADGYTPTSYAGEESITFPNGFIMKQGTATSINTGDTTVEFDDDFPSAITNAWTTWGEVVANDVENCGVHTMLVGSMKLRNPNSGWTGKTINWFAIGY